jgi:hypothetical protein
VNVQGFALKEDVRPEDAEALALERWPSQAHRLLFSARAVADGIIAVRPVGHHKHELGFSRSGWLGIWVLAARSYWTRLMYSWIALFA